MKKRSKQKSGSASPGDKENLAIRIGDLELENQSLKRVIEELGTKLNDPKSSASSPKIVELKKLGIHSHLSPKSHKSDPFQDEIQRLKVQKVKLQCNMKLESMQFRLCKASLEKEILQLKKEQIRNKFEKHVLSNLFRRQKHVLQRKTEEASVAAKRLKQLTESRKASSGKVAGPTVGIKVGTKGVENEFEVKMKIDEVRSKYERRIEKMVDEIKKLKLELEMLKDEKSSCRTEDNEATINDSELVDLRDEITKLSCMVSQMNMSKPQLVPADTSQTAVSIGSNIHTSGTDASELEHSEGITSMKEKPSGVSVTIGSNIHKSATDASDLEHSEGITSITEKPSGVSVSIGSNIHTSGTDASELELSEGITAMTEKPSGVSVSIGSNIHTSGTDASKLEHSKGITSMTEKPSGVCCSCSKKSTCKTQKCGCRAAGGSCGVSCGCSLAKCTNRNISFKLDGMPRPEMPKDIMLDSIEEHKGTVEECGPRKQPLREIGNTTIKSIATKPGLRKKGQKAVIHTDTTDLTSSLVENTRGTRRANKN